MKSGREVVPLRVEESLIVWRMGRGICMSGWMVIIEAFP